MFQLMLFHAYQDDGPAGRRLRWIPEIIHGCVLHEHVASANIHGLVLIVIKRQGGGDRPFAHANDDGFLSRLLLHVPRQPLDFMSCLTPEVVLGKAHVRNAGDAKHHIVHGERIK